MLVGNVDLVKPDRIAGWAADTETPRSVVEVSILVDGVVQAFSGRVRWPAPIIGLLTSQGPSGDG